MTHCLIMTVPLCTENSAIGIQTGGQESLRDGKSLFLSGHVCKAQYHGISGNVSYCFVRADIVRETSLSAVPYIAWVILHKSAGCLTEAYCSCPAGLRGTCKHISAMCHMIINCVVKKQNCSVTSQTQSWGCPGKKLHEPDFVEIIVIQKFQGYCSMSW